MHIIMHCRMLRNVCLSLGLHRPWVCVDSVNDANDCESYAIKCMLLIGHWIAFESNHFDGIWLALIKYQICQLHLYNTPLWPLIQSQPVRHPWIYFEQCWIWNTKLKISYVHKSQSLSLKRILSQFKSISSRKSMKTRAYRTEQ